MIQGVPRCGGSRRLLEHTLLVRLSLDSSEVPHLNTAHTSISFCHLPEITEEALTEEMQTKGIKDEVGPFWKQYRCIFGFIAQMSYV